MGGIRGGSTGVRGGITGASDTGEGAGLGGVLALAGGGGRGGMEGVEFEEGREEEEIAGGSKGRLPSTNGSCFRWRGTGESVHQRNYTRFQISFVRTRRHGIGSVL